MHILKANDPIYSDLNGSFIAGRYHSWVVDRSSCPEALEITATDDQGEIMSFKHREFPVWGVQYHPESIMTKDGKKILANFFEYCISK